LAGKTILLTQTVIVLGIIFAFSVYYMRKSTVTDLNTIKCVVAGVLVVCLLSVLLPYCFLFLVSRRRFYAFRPKVLEIGANDKEANTFFFSEYLTWQELIHTNYFNVPRFRMLVAYTIADSEGFRPTEAFRNHPDYSCVADWYEEIKPKEAQGAA
jgi:hypothetical protein